MKIKIAIYPNYGSIYVPPFIRNQLNEKNFIYERIKMAEIIEQLEFTHKEASQEIYDMFRSDEPNELNFFDYIKFEDFPNSIIVKDLERKYGQLYEISIEEVDTTKVWKIEEYDGAEAIEYFHEPTIVDKNLNMGEW